MKVIIKYTGLLFFCFTVSYGQQELKLLYNKPASVWTEALPIGNGRLGAMVFGGINEELIQLNEATLWSGGPVQKKVNPTAFDNLEKVRTALFNEDFQKGYDLSKNMQGMYTESYMPLGDLTLKQDFGNQKVENYHRELNIQNGIATSTFTINGVDYKREYFVSAPNQVIVIRLSANKPKQLSVLVDAGSQLRNKKTLDGDLLFIKGKAPSHVDPSYYNENKEPIIYDDSIGCRGMRFEFIIKPIVKDGTISTKNNLVSIENASEIVLLVSAATSFNGFDKCPDSQGKDEHKLALDAINKNQNKAYPAILKEHLTDFKKLFDRVSFTLNKDEENQSNMPTDERLVRYSKKNLDSNLESLYFQFGRYLLISSSRTPNAPANLQGIWNKEIRPPWSSNYTTNINVQMNYWPVESANLSELFSPLNDLIKNVSITGKETAESYYHTKGWVLHHNSDIWATTNPVGDLGKGDPMWANWYMGSNWLSRHLWEHYQYTQDKEYLKKVYPIIKGAAEFTLDWLQKDKNGYWVTIPSTSPENEFYYGDRKKGKISIASTMDMGIIKDLFSNVIAAGEILKTDDLFTTKIIETQRNLLPFQIGSKGQLQEWYKDFEDVDAHHRHTSHLYALHPANEISPLKTPELALAAKKTLELRGDDGTGWSLAWKVNMWARLLDGNHAYVLFRNLLRLTKENDTNYQSGGAYPNLFDAHPPFQIDGNFAGTAGVIEMLMQSQNSEIHLLPALPDTWRNGTIKGIVAKGNFVIDINWDQHQLVSATIESRSGGMCTVRTSIPIQVKGLDAKSTKSNIGFVTAFKTKKGKEYIVIPN